MVSLKHSLIETLESEVDSITATLSTTVEENKANFERWQEKLSENKKLKADVAVLTENNKQLATQRFDLMEEVTHWKSLHRMLNEAGSKLAETGTKILVENQALHEELLAAKEALECYHNIAACLDDGDNFVAALALDRLNNFLGYKPEEKP